MRWSKIILFEYYQYNNKIFNIIGLQNANL